MSHNTESIKSLSCSSAQHVLKDSMADGLPEGSDSEHVDRVGWDEQGCRVSQCEWTVMNHTYEILWIIDIIVISSDGRR